MLIMILHEYYCVTGDFSHTQAKKGLKLKNGTAWMDGKIIPISEAKIGVTDWGLTRSDITYDVVHVWQGAFFRLEEYLQRFENSIQKMRLSIPQSSEDIRGILHQIVSASKLENAYCSMVASRGTPIVPGTRDPRACNNHFYAWCVPYIHVIPPEVAQRGAHLLIVDSVERISPQSIDPTVKNYHWGDLTKGQFEALDAGFDISVLADSQGNITEGPGFNIFAVIEGEVVTPNRGVLEGITRRTILEICAELEITAKVRPVSKHEFLEAEEIFTATTAGGPVPVTRVNNTILSNDSPGPLTQELKDTYWNWHNRPEHREEINYG